MLSVPQLDVKNAKIAQKIPWPNLEYNKMDQSLERLKYETSIHHKQVLRHSLNDKIVEQIESSHAPAHNYQKAFQ